MDRAHLIYLTFNSERQIVNLPHLVGTAGEELPILAVDNCSTDGSVDKMSEIGLTKIRRMEENLGFTGGINHALGLAQAEWMVIANPDIRPMADGWLDKLLSVPHDVGIVGARLSNDVQTSGGGRILVESEPLRRAISVPCMNGRVFSRHHLGWSRMSMNIGGMSDFTEAREVPWVAFAMCALRMGMIREIGPLDQNYWHFVSDQELCLRAWSRDWKVMYQPVPFWHTGGASMEFAPDYVSDYIRSDISRWCDVEHAHLRTSGWA